MIFAVFSAYAFSQDGKILEQTKIDSSFVDSLFERYPDPKEYALATHRMALVDIYRITYLSDGLKVKGYMDLPKAPGRYPCIIYNRGGNRENGRLTVQDWVKYMAQMATWGYCVVASQYRGNSGGEGHEEFGGKDLDDVLNMMPLLNEVDRADTSRIGMYGVSRGGMMTYLSLTRTNKMKAAVVISGIADFKQAIETVTWADSLFAHWLPEYRDDKASFIAKRSPILHAEQICKTTPIFIIQGTADIRVTTPQVFDLARKFYELKQPFRLDMYEGGTHDVFEYREEFYNQIKSFFDDYLRDGKKWPSLELHEYKNNAN